MGKGLLIVIIFLAIVALVVIGTLYDPTAGTDKTKYKYKYTICDSKVNCYDVDNYHKDSVGCIMFVYQYYSNFKGVIVNKPITLCGTYIIVDNFDQ